MNAIYTFKLISISGFMFAENCAILTCAAIFLAIWRIRFDCSAFGSITTIGVPISPPTVVRFWSWMAVQICPFEKRDVVRHPLVQRIVNAYELHRAAPTTAVPAPPAA